MDDRSVYLLGDDDRSSTCEWYIFIFWYKIVHIWYIFSIFYNLVFQGREVMITGDDVDDVVRNYVSRSAFLTTSTLKSRPTDWFSE